MYKFKIHKEVDYNIYFYIKIKEISFLQIHSN